MQNIITVKVSIIKCLIGLEKYTESVNFSKALINELKDITDTKVFTVYWKCAYSLNKLEQKNEAIFCLKEAIEKFKELPNFKAGNSSKEELLIISELHTELAALLIERKDNI